MNKVKILVISFLFIISASSFASVFVPYSKITTLPGHVTVELINNHYHAMACSGEIIGYKVFGNQVLPFSNIIVAPGAVMPITLWAAGAPFVSSNYIVRCALIGW